MYYNSIMNVYNIKIFLQLELYVELYRCILTLSNIKKLELIMAKTKAQKQKDYIEYLKAKDLLTYNLSKSKRRKSYNN